MRVGKKVKSGIKKDSYREGFFLNLRTFRLSTFVLFMQPPVNYGIHVNDFRPFPFGFTDLA
ncbi:hypothetical protein A4R26_20575 [Niastella populi]|uniref:Uncharacterized protein n=1 Tax=Niastella populi TaxID=550983 RepID=A0A1V9FN75_9BACT|nr:hypothetical protein A4R26_20575 [Niastella populi]